MGDTTLSHGSIKLIGYWRNRCSKEHKTCKLSIQTWEKYIGFDIPDFVGPTRLIEVGTHDEPVLRLRYSKDLQDPYAPYVSLSHCWGTQPILRLTSENHDSFLEEIPYENLPRTFQHIVDITRTFKNINYLWIDSLCILQNSPSDWEQESLKMHEVYTNSVITFAAAQASDGSMGCGVIRDSSVLYPPVITFTRNRTWVEWLQSVVNQDRQPDLPEGDYLCVDTGLWEREIDQSPLADRGWVAQERFLSRQIVYFARSQLFWECAEMKACESFPLGCPLSMRTVEVFPEGHALLKKSFHGLEKLNRYEILGIWDKLVTAYSSLKLSRTKDKLNAIAGMAQQFRLPLMAAGGDFCDYSAGLWTGIRGSHTVSQLLWHTKEPQLRPNPSRAPTWSWASVDSPVTDVFAMRTVESERIKKIAGSYHCVEMNLVREGMGAQYGENRGGEVRLYGMLIPASLILYDYEEDHDTGHILELRKSAGYFVGISIWLDVLQQNIEGRLHCVPLVARYNDATATSVEGLILRRIAGRGTYHRIGVFWSAEREVIEDLMAPPTPEELDISDDCYLEKKTHYPTQPFVFLIK